MDPVLSRELGPWCRRPRRSQFSEKRKLAEQRGEQPDATVAILNTCRMNDRVQQQTLHVDKNMPFLTLDQFARIEPVRINTGPPFSALFTLWLSMAQAVGLASRSAFSAFDVQCMMDLSTRAYRLKASNAAPSISTFAGTSSLPPISTA